ncbi:MAG: NADPH-dependent FMN reductase [Acholeplasmataceae bacterium]
MSEKKVKIGIILGSTREGRVSPQVGQWIYELGQKRTDATFEIVDIKAFDLPFLGTTEDKTNSTKWNDTLARLDAFVFVTAEYNRSIPGALKNAIDLAYDNWNNKAAGVVSYGSVNGARAAETLRGIFAELQIADVRTHVALSMFTDFEKWSTFKPQDLHLKNVEMMFDQLITWSKALESVRA